MSASGAPLGAPVSEVNMLGPLDIHQYLLEHDVHHEIVRLPRPAAGGEYLAEVLGVTPRRCLAIHPFHTLTRDGDVLVLVLTPADETPTPATLAAALSELLRDRFEPDAEFRVAGADLVSRRTDYVAGHLAPLLLPADVIVVSTRGVFDLATSIIYTATGDGGTALGISATDLLNLSKAIVLPTDAPADRGSLADGSDRIELDPVGTPPPASTPFVVPLPSQAEPTRPLRGITTIAATAS
jgi:prolyl-tRNA editing enzyme YbaK/EbsC (Cys-tRNA(Pro) deacylase)